MHMSMRMCILTVCKVDSGAMPSLLTVSLKVYSTSASSSEPEMPNTGPLRPKPKFRLEQWAAPCRHRGNEEQGEEIRRLSLD